MTDNFIMNRVRDIESLQQSLADEVKDEATKGPTRLELSATVIVHLEFARQELLKAAGKEIKWLHRSDE